MVLIQKWPVIQLFFLGNIGQENVFLQYSRTKKRLSRPLKQEIQKVEKLRFFQRIWSKNGHFSTFFSQYWPGKCVLPCSRTKKSLCTL